MSNDEQTTKLSRSIEEFRRCFNHYKSLTEIKKIKEAEASKMYQDCLKAAVALDEAKSKLYEALIDPELMDESVLYSTLGNKPF